MTTPTRPHSKRFRKFLILIFALPLAAIALVLLYAKFATIPGEKLVPAGFVRNQAHYVTMPDGTPIALDVWLPADMADGATVPTIMETTRYWRAMNDKVGSRLMRLLGEPNGTVALFNPAGYAVVLVDARGSGASGGKRPIEWSPAEVADMANVVDWIIAQPWSDGKVGGFGISYSGNTAELLSATGHPAIRAVAPHYADFDPYLQLAVPNGVLNRGIISEWGAFVSGLDHNDTCVLVGGAGLTCTVVKALFADGVKPVGDDMIVYQNALAEHESNINVFEAVTNAPFVDDAWGDLTLGAVSPYSYQTEQEVAQVPSFFVVSWHDAGTVDGALNRFMTFDTPQQVVIAAVPHGGGSSTDPFLAAETPNPYGGDQENEDLLTFFDAHLKNDSVLEREIRYYTLGANEWKRTTEWPPAGVEMQTFWFSAENQLTQTPPSDSTATDTYTVDFSATTGATTRWHTQIGGDTIAYPNRTEQADKLLTYTTDPVPEPVEITGNPIVTLYVASTSEDGAFHAYLESVAPDGTVTYITEGMLRGIQRNISTTTPPYIPTGPYHTFHRADAQPLIPNKVAEITFQLYATSVQIPAGHRIRVSLAGHDASVFERYPADGIPAWTVQRNTTYPSAIELPMKMRTD